MEASSMGVAWPLWFSYLAEWGLHCVPLKAGNGIGKGGNPATIV